MANRLFHLMLIGEMLLQHLVPDDACDTAINLVELLLAHIDESNAPALLQRPTIRVGGQIIETGLYPAPVAAQLSRMMPTDR